MPFIVDFVRSQYTRLPLAATPAAVEGGTYVVTGSNTGLGLECAKHLARLGAARLILAVRSSQRGDAALATIHEETGRSDVGEVWELDLASLASVEAFAARLAALDRVDAVIANAGVSLVEYALADGFEESLMINFVATMLLAVRALPVLRASAEKFKIQPHLVVVASSVAFIVDGPSVDVDGNILEALSTRDASVMSQRYQLTKQLQIYAVRELARLVPVAESGVVINTLNPGMCSTDLQRHSRLAGKLAMGLVGLFVGRTAEEGSRTLVHAAVAGPETHGKYLSDCEDKEHEMPAWMRDESGSRVQKRVWEDLVKALKARGHSIDIP